MLLSSTTDQTAPAYLKHNAKLWVVADRGVDQWTRLLPEDHCRAIISELTPLMVPATRDQAVECTRHLIGSFPKRELNDPEIYTAMMVAAFQDFPPDLGKAAVIDVTKRLRYTPTRADLYAWLEVEMDERLRALQTAKEMLAEHARRREEANKPKPKAYADLTDAERAEFDASITAATRWRTGGTDDLTCRR